jgi:hypothetical protein
MAMNKHWLWVLLMATACGSKKEGGAAASGDKAVSGEQGTEAKALSPDFFGKTPTPPGLLAKLKWGMPEADARKAVPVMFSGYVNSDKDFFGHKDPAYADVNYSLGVDKDKHVVSRENVTVPKSAQAMITAAWGPGKEGKTVIGPRTFWFDPASGWRAYVEPGMDNIAVEFHPYLPVAKLLGDGPDTLGFAPQGLIGATLDDLRKRFPDTIVERSQAQAAADQRDASKFAGQDLSKKLGKAHADVSLDLPPTEFGEFETPVNFMWSDDGKVVDAWFGIPYEAYAPAKDEIHAAIEKKWGAGKPTEYLGEKATMYRDKAPFVIVTDDTISHEWDVRLVDKKPD